MKKYTYIDTNTRAVSHDLSAIFPGWSGQEERLMVYSPHDDDAILGAGYAMRAAMEDGAEVHICIVCSGNDGYSTPEERDTIVEKRQRKRSPAMKLSVFPASASFSWAFPISARSSTWVGILRLNVRDISAA